MLLLVHLSPYCSGFSWLSCGSARGSSGEEGGAGGGGGEVVTRVGTDSEPAVIAGPLQ